jgi:hypothetical protein
VSPVQSKNEGKAIAAGCLGLIGMGLVYVGFIAALVWVIATVIHGVFF